MASEDFEGLCREHYEQIARLAYLIAQDRHEALDVTQEAFARAYERWRSVSQLQRPEAWVQRVAANLALSWRRRAKRVLLPASLPEGVEPFPESFDLVLGEALKELTPAQRAVVAFNGPVDVSGSVEEDVVSFNGPITIRSGAVVGGDVVGRVSPDVEEGATVQGDIRRNPFDLFRDPFPFVARFAAWVAVTVSMLILGLLLLLLLPRGMDAVANAWRTGPGPSIGWGLIILIGLPIVAVLLLITLVGIPLGFGMLFALGLIYAIGYVAGAWVLGRLLLKPPTSQVLALPSRPGHPPARGPGPHPCRHRGVCGHSGRPRSPDGRGLVGGPSRRACNRHLMMA